MLILQVVELAAEFLFDLTPFEDLVLLQKNKKVLVVVQHGATCDAVFWNVSLGVSLVSPLSLVEHW